LKKTRIRIYIGGRSLIALKEKYMKWIFGRTAMWIWATLALATVAFAAVQEPPLPEGDGKKILQNSCTTCHGLDGTVKMRLDKAGWEGVVASMVSNGAQVDAKEMPVLIDYLVTNFGNAKPVAAQAQAGNTDAAAKKLLDEACTTCHDLDLVSGQRYTKDDWQNVVNSMIAKGAAMGEKDVPMLVEYLVKMYGKK
jgi:cytochrome c5